MVRNYQKFIFLVALTSILGACALIGIGNRGNDDPSLPADVLFQDFFSDPSSGWDRVIEIESITDYADGTYRILVNTDHSHAWANPGLNIQDAVIEVDAQKMGGSDDNLLGIICRYQNDSNFYIFTISSDGFYGIVKLFNGVHTLIDLENMEYSQVINQGLSSNKIQADCTGNRLALHVNGEKLLEVNDSTFRSGDVGLIAGTFDMAGTDIRFDNFVVRKP